MFFLTKFDGYPVLNHLNAFSWYPAYLIIFDADFLPITHRIILDNHFVTFMKNKQTGAVFAWCTSYCNAWSEHNGLVSMR